MEDYTRNRWCTSGQRSVMYKYKHLVHISVTWSYMNGDAYGRGYVEEMQATLLSYPNSHKVNRV